MKRSIVSDNWPTEQLREQAEAILAAWPDGPNDLTLRWETRDALAAPVVLSRVCRQNRYTTHDDAIEIVWTPDMLAQSPDLAGTVRTIARQCTDSFERAEYRARADLLVGAYFHESLDPASQVKRDSFTRVEVVDVVTVAIAILQGQFDYVRTRRGVEGQSEPNGHCRECKWWEIGPHVQPRDDTRWLCQLTESRHAHRVHAQSKCVAMDDDGTHALLWCLPNFGCAQFTPKEAPA